MRRLATSSVSAAIVLAAAVAAPGCNTLFGLDETSDHDGGTADARASDARDGDGGTSPDAALPACADVPPDVHIYLCTGFDGEPFDQGLSRLEQNGSVERAVVDDAPSAPAALRSSVPAGVIAAAAVAHAPVGDGTTRAALRVSVDLDDACLVDDAAQATRLLAFVYIDGAQRLPVYTIGLEVDAVRSVLFEEIREAQNGEPTRAEVALPALPREWTEIVLEFDLEGGKINIDFGKTDEAMVPTLAPDGLRDLQATIGLVTTGAHGPCQVSYDDFVVTDLAGSD